jgi:peptidoglycan/xylan/chitin deacetylase (PgdA/CDA1 family)
VHLFATSLNVSRRQFLARSLTGSAAAGLGLLGSIDAAAEDKLPAASDRPEPADDQALVAITLDLEMSRNFPKWEETHWDYEKGNLNAETKAYAVEACRRVKSHGGVLHSFVVGQVLEQENIDWLKEIVAAGHPVGSHTYDHIYVKATRLEDIQFRFRRAPWLIKDKSIAEVVRENIRLNNVAMKARLGIDPAGFRTPGGFADGLIDRPDVQQMLLDAGFSWVSSLYPAHPIELDKRPDAAMFQAIRKAHAVAQPFVYPTGLIEVPMNPISDVGAFRNGRWPLADFLKAIRMGVEWAIENRAVFDFLAHPSCLYVTDPKFETIEMICDLVKKSKGRAAIVDLGTIARRAERQKRKPPAQL